MADPHWSEGLGKLHEHWVSSQGACGVGQGAGRQHAWDWGLAPAVGFPEPTQDHHTTSQSHGPAWGLTCETLLMAPLPREPLPHRQPPWGRLWETLGLASLSSPGAASSA